MFSLAFIKLLAILEHSQQLKPAVQIIGALSLSTYIGLWKKNTELWGLS